MWKELTSQSDIDELMRVFGSFHDSCLKEVAIRNREYVTSKLAMGFDNKPIVKLLFQRQFTNPTAIELQFEEVEIFNWFHFRLADDTGFSIIYQAVFTYYKEFTLLKTPPAPMISFSHSLSSRNQLPPQPVIFATVTKKIRGRARGPTPYPTTGVSR